MSILTTFSQTSLSTLATRLKIVMDNIEVLVRWEIFFAHRTRNEIFELARSAQQAIAGIEAELLANALDHTVDFRFEIRRVVDDIEIGMADPGGSCFVVQVASMFDAFRTT